MLAHGDSTTCSNARHSWVRWCIFESAKMFYRFLYTLSTGNYSFSKYGKDPMVTSSYQVSMVMTVLLVYEIILTGRAVSPSKIVWTIKVNCTAVTTYLTSMTATKFLPTNANTTLHFIISCHFPSLSWLFWQKEAGCFDGAWGIHQQYLLRWLYLGCTQVSFYFKKTVNFLLQKLYIVLLKRRQLAMRGLQYSPPGQP